MSLLPGNMEPIREITEDDVSSVSEINYNNFQSVRLEDSIHQLREDVRAEVLAKQLQSVTTSGCSLSACSCPTCLKVIFFTIVIALIWMAMSVPTIIYIVNVVGNSATENSNCTNNSNESNTTCMMEQYTELVCKDALSLLQQCAHGDTNKLNHTRTPIYIAPGLDQKALEKKAELLQYGKSQVSEDCIERLLPFACLYLFPLDTCDANEKSKVIRASRGECVSLKEDVCRNIWQLIEKLPTLRDQLPDCDTLPAEPEVDVLNYCTSNATDVAPSDVPLNLSCSRDFKPFNNSRTKEPQCVPVCQQWSPYSPITVRVTDILTIVTASFSLLSGSALLILGCIRYKRIFSYPSIFVIYQTFPPMVLAVLVLVGFTARSTLFCSSEDLQSSIFKPSIFCIITGIAFHYFLLQLLFWWLCHITAVFQGTLFPLHTKGLQSRRKLKYIHATMFGLGWVLPVVPVAIVVPKGVSLTRFPTVLCTGIHPETIFGAMVVPISILIAVGSTMLVFILWTVIKRHIQARRNQLRVKLDWTAEAKVLAILAYYLVLGAVVLTILTKSLVSVRGFYTEIVKYFACEAQGIRVGDLDSLDTDAVNSTEVLGIGSGGWESLDMEPTNSTCDRTGFEGLINPVPTTVAFILLGLYPLINLVYIINVRELREKLMCKEERKVEVVHADSSRGNIQSTMFRPVVRNRGDDFRTSLFDSAYVRHTTFKPLPPTPPPRRL